MHLADHFNWDNKGDIAIAVCTPIVLFLFWFYAVRVLRYLLDWVFAYVWWAAKIVGVVGGVGTWVLMALFNVYLFKYYGHQEPMTTVLAYGGRAHDAYSAFAAFAQLYVDYGAMAYRAFWA